MREELANRAAFSPNVRELLDQAKAAEPDDPTTSRVLVQQARALAQSLGDRAGEAEAFYRLASLAYSSGNADEAFLVAVEASELATKCRAVVVAVWALNLMGIVHFDAGNHSEALACCLRGLEQYRTTDHRVDEGYLLNTVATIHHAIGDLDRAIVTYEAALDADRLLPRPDLDAITLANMAQLRAERSEFFLAVSLGESALELSREHATGLLPEVLANLGEAYANLNDPGRGQVCFDEALRILDDWTECGTDGNPAATIAVRTCRGKAAMIGGDFGRAEGDLLIALDLARQAKARMAELSTLGLLASLYRQLGRFEDALARQESRFELHQTLFDQGSDLRIKALQIAHDTEHARQQVEQLQSRTSALETVLGQRTHELEGFQAEAFKRLAILAEFRDTDTGEHSARVADLSAEIANVLGLAADFCEELRLAARLHDVGKVGVPDAILFKAGPLAADEAAVMRSHTTAGAKILSASGWPPIQLAEVVALHHHERWDGAGYPAGLRGADIPLGARIVSVADVYDALTNARLYNPAWSHDDGVAYLLAGRGSQFDPEVVDAFQTLIAPR